MQLRHLDGDRIGGRLHVVGFVRTLEHLVEDVGPHDHAVLAGEQRRQHRDERRRRVTRAHGESAGVVHATEQRVAEVPRAVLREIDGVGPAALRREVAVVAHGPGERDLLVHLAHRRHRDDVDDEVGRRRQLDQERLRRRRLVVVFRIELEHAAAGRVDAGPGRIGDDEDVVRTGDPGRQPELSAGVVAGAGCERATVLDATEIAVGVRIEVLVGREIDVILPGRLRYRGRAGPAVLDAPCDVDHAADEKAFRNRDARHLEIRGIAQHDRQRAHGDVVALVAELLHVVGREPDGAGLGR